MGAMTSLASIIALLAIAAAGAWAWVHDRARKLAEKRAREESERLVAERWVAHEIVLAEAEVRINARLQVEAEERIRKEAEAKEEVRLAEEHRLAAERQAAEAKRRAEAEAQAREEARLKAEAEAEAKQQAEEAEARARELPKARGFSAPKPSPISKTFGKNEPKPGSTPRADNTAPIRLQLVFGRGSAVRMLALVPHRRDGMPNTLEVTTTNGVLQLAEWSEDAYQPIPVSEFPDALSEGLVWQAREGDQQWRWELTRRELYVLAAGDECGFLHGFVTRRYDQRLWLNTRHVILAQENLRESVIAALAEAGCQPPTVYDATTPGVPSGWFLIRDVIPTRAVPMREERDPLNVLCPAHEIEPQFVGGIRLERNVWLAGFAPRIRFDGELEDGFEVRIDSHPAQRAADGALEAPGWDDEGEHRLWFGGQAVTYVLRTMREEWDHWQAYDFGTGAAICGATTHWIDGARWRQVRIPAANPLLVGARPGEIFYGQPRTDVCSETIIALVPFTPVWALPLDPVHADKRSARLVSLETLEPATTTEHKRSLQINDPVSRWAAAINDAGRKQLALSPENEATQALWRRYRAIAKQLWKQGKKQR